MNNLKEQMIYDLAKEYTFKNFNFEKSPKELLFFFQKVKEEISKEVERQDTELTNSITQAIYGSY